MAYRTVQYRFFFSKKILFCVSFAKAEPRNDFTLTAFQVKHLLVYIQKTCHVFYILATLIPYLKANVL